jgi:YVTN family beta-propeller protein
VIDTATNAVAATVPLPQFVFGTGTGIAVTPDGAHVYVSMGGSGISAVMVIATATNTVVATVGFPSDSTVRGIAVSPDGTRVYVAVTLQAGNCGQFDTCAFVSVVDTTTNTVVATVPTVQGSDAVAVTPDGARLYVVSIYGAVSVFDTVTNTLVATVQVPSLAVGIGIQPVTSFAFAAFSAKVDISPSTGSFDMNSTFTLGTGSRGINPLTQPVTLKVGAFTATIPAGSFQQNPQGFVFGGIINGVALEVIIVPQGSNSFALRAQGTGASNLPTTNPVTVGLTIGNNADTTTVTANIQ